MSSHKRNFQCFNPVGGEGSHKFFCPHPHPTSRLPRIPQHGMMGSHEPPEECYLCSEYRHSQALEALQTQVSPLYHTPYQHHHLQQFVLSRPTRPDEPPVAHCGHEQHINHHRYNKKIVLLKNSDPSFRKAIILNRRGLRSLGLFLEEVSDLMQYHTRKLYTLEGCKIESIQGLLQCPSVLVCVGCEPFHPTILEKFHIPSDDKLPKLSVKARSTGFNEGQDALSMKRHVIKPKVESGCSSIRRSVSSDKSLPDGTESPDDPASCPPTSDGVRDDDIEKVVRVNKDGSLSMKMKVRFRLQNAETLHWSTEVRKTMDRNSELVQGQVSERNYSGFQYVTPCDPDEVNDSRQYPSYTQGLHCPHCCSHCQEYDIWKNIPGTHAASRCIQTSSSSASSHTMVTRKTVVEGRQTVARSSEEYTEQVMEEETCVQQIETVECCTIRSEIGSTNELPPCTQEKSEDCNISQSDQVSTKTDEEEGSNTGNVDVDGRPLSQYSSISPISGESMTAGQSSKLKKSKKLHVCQCGASDDTEGEKANNAQFVETDEIIREQSSAMSDKSCVSVRSNKPEDVGNMEPENVEETTPKSAMSVNSNASTICKPDVLDVEEYGKGKSDDDNIEHRPSSIKSEKSVKTDLTAEQPKSEEDVVEERTPSSLSATSITSIKSRGSRVHFPPSNEGGEKSAEETKNEPGQRAQSSMSVKSNVSSKSKLSQRTPEEYSEVSTHTSVSLKSKGSNEISDEELETEEAAEEEQRAASIISNHSARCCSKASNPKDEGMTAEITSSSLSEKSRKSKTPENEELPNTNELELDSAEAVTETVVRSPSTLSIKSGKSNVSVRSRQSKSSEFPAEVGHAEEVAEERPQSSVSIHSVKSVTSCDSIEENTMKDDEVEARPPSSMSHKSAMSKSSTQYSRSEKYEETSGQINNDKERTQSAMSAKSAVSNASAVSSKSKSSQVVLNLDGMPKEGDTEHEGSQRSPSCMSNKSVKSHNSSKSKRCVVSDREDVTEQEEERGPSVLSVKSEQSHTSASSAKSKRSGISTKSNMSKPGDISAKENISSNIEHEERPLSNMSGKSTKSRASMKLTTNSENSVSGEATEERAQSSMSVQSAETNISLKSNRSKCSARVPVEESFESINEGCDDEQSKERPASCLSSKSVQSSVSDKSIKSSERVASALSAKSAKSQVSTKSRSSKMSEVQMPEGADVTEERIVEGESEGRATSSMSTKSDNSVRSSKSKCSSSVPIKEESNCSDKMEQTEERASSCMSAKSDQSQATELSVKSAERATSALTNKSSKSHVSAKSVKSNTAENCPEKDVSITDEGEENNAITPDRVQSNMSVRSEKSVHSNVSVKSKNSKVSDISLEDGADIRERIVEGESEGRAVSPMSVQSVRSTVSARSSRSRCSANVVAPDVSECSDGTYDREQTEERASRKSDTSPVSETLIKSAKRSQSALSTKSAKSHVSAKSIKSNASENCSGKNIDVSDKDDSVKESDERVNSAMSGKTAESAMSTKSKGLDGWAVENTFDHEEHEERAQSNRSVRSTKSAKSNVSVTSQKDIPSDHDAETLAEDQGERLSDIRSMSSMSIHSVKSDLSARSRKSKSSADASADDGLARPKSHVSKKSRKSNVSEVLSDADTPIKGNDEEEPSDRAESEMSAKSAKSATSAKSNKSTLSNAQGGDTASCCNTSVKSAKSSRSGVSKSSKKSKVSDMVSENCTEIAETEKLGSPQSVPSEAAAEEENEESAASCVSANSALSNLKSVISDENIATVEGNEARVPSAMSARSNHSRKDSPASGNSHKGETLKEMAEAISPSNASTESTKTNASASSRSTTAYESLSKENQANYEGTDDRPVSALSAKSKRSTKSAQSKTFNIGEENNDDPVERAPSIVSIKSTKSRKSNSTGVSKQSKASKPPTVDNANLAGENTEDRAMSSMSAKSAISVMSSVSAKSNIQKQCGEESGVDCAVTEERILSPVTAESLQSEISSVTSRKSEIAKQTAKMRTGDETKSIVSVKSNLSSQTKRSNISGDASRSEREIPAVAVEESDDRSTTAMSSKSDLTECSKRTSENKGKQTEGRTKSSLSVKSNISKKSRKSKEADKVTDADNKDMMKKSTGSDVSAGKNTPEITHEENVDTTNLSNDDVVKESPAIEDKSKTKNGPLEVADDSKSSKSYKGRNSNADNAELVPSNLPNASPTEVVNEWLKKIPADSEILNIEELAENSDGQKTVETVEETTGGEIKDNDNSEAGNIKDPNEATIESDLKNESQTTTEPPKEDNESEREDYSKMFQSSVQVMKVLLNPKLDRCNSLPEVSSVYGRKLSTSARGLLDCLVKLQLIDHDPKNANEKDERYLELMNILQSLWLCEPQENGHLLHKDDHQSTNDEFNQTSSSGVDVNSGSTGSGKSSDGVNGDVTQLQHTSDTLNRIQELHEAEDDPDTQWTPEQEVVKQKGDDQATDVTIRSNESPKELPETPPSSNNSSGNDSSGQKAVETECPEDTSSENAGDGDKLIAEDTDPIWVLTLLANIEKQFMTHYVNAMKEFKVRWNLDDSEQLDQMIHELNDEVHHKIQKSIKRELTKIQRKAGLPRPPKDATPSSQAGDRRRRLKTYRIQTEKSDDSATGTSYSDQRNEIEDESCPCDTCIKNQSDTKAAESLVEKVISVAVNEVKEDKVKHNGSVEEAQEESPTEDTKPVEINAGVLDEEAADSAKAEGEDAAEEIAIATLSQHQSLKEDPLEIGGEEVREEATAACEDDLQECIETSSNTNAEETIEVTTILEDTLTQQADDTLTGDMSHTSDDILNKNDGENDVVANEADEALEIIDGSDEGEDADKEVDDNEDSVDAYPNEPAEDEKHLDRDTTVGSEDEVKSGEGEITAPDDENTTEDENDEEEIPATSADECNEEISEDATEDETNECEIAEEKDIGVTDESKEEPDGNSEAEDMIDMTHTSQDESLKEELDDGGETAPTEQEEEAAESEEEAAVENDVGDNDGIEESDLTCADEHEIDKDEDEESDKAPDHSTSNKDEAAENIELDENEDDIVEENDLTALSEDEVGRNDRAEETDDEAVTQNESVKEVGAATEGDTVLTKEMSVASEDESKEEAIEANEAEQSEVASTSQEESEGSATADDMAMSNESETAADEEETDTENTEQNYMAEEQESEAVETEDEAVSAKETHSISEDESKEEPDESAKVESMAAASQGEANEEEPENFGASEDSATSDKCEANEAGDTKLETEEENDITSEEGDATAVNEIEKDEPVESGTGDDLSLSDFEEPAENDEVEETKDETAVASDIAATSEDEAVENTDEEADAAADQQAVVDKTVDEETQASGEDEAGSDENEPSEAATTEHEVSLTTEKEVISKAESKDKPYEATEAEQSYIAAANLEESEEDKPEENAVICDEKEALQNDEEGETEDENVSQDNSVADTVEKASVNETESEKNEHESGTSGDTASLNEYETEERDDEAGDKNDNESRNTTKEDDETALSEQETDGDEPIETDTVEDVPTSDNSETVEKDEAEETEDREDVLTENEDKAEDDDASEDENAEASDCAAEDDDAVTLRENVSDKNLPQSRDIDDVAKRNKCETTENNEGGEDGDENAEENDNPGEEDEMTTVTDHQSVEYESESGMDDDGANTNKDGTSENDDVDTEDGVENDSESLHENAVEEDDMADLAGHEADMDAAVEEDELHEEDTGEEKHVSSEDEVKENEEEAARADDEHGTEDKEHKLENESEYESDEEQPDTAATAEDIGEPVTNTDSDSAENIEVDTTGIDASTERETTDEDEGTADAVSTTERDNSSEEEISGAEADVEETTTEVAGEQESTGATSDNEPEEGSKISTIDEQESPISDQDTNEGNGEDTTKSELVEDMMEAEFENEISDAKDGNALDSTKAFIDENVQEKAVSTAEDEEKAECFATEDCIGEGEDNKCTFEEESSGKASVENEEEEAAENDRADEDCSEAATTGEEQDQQYETEGAVSEQHEKEASEIVECDGGEETASDCLSGEEEVGKTKTERGETLRSTMGESNGKTENKAKESVEYQNEKEELQEGGSAEDEEVEENSVRNSDTYPDEDQQICQENEMTEEHQVNETNDETEDQADSEVLQNEVVGEKISSMDEDNQQPDINVTQCENINIRNRSQENKGKVEVLGKEKEKYELPIQAWNVNQGESADGEDEAEDSDGSEEETDDGEKVCVPGKAENQEATETETKLIPFNTLSKISAESEEGVYADVEDSETEINSKESLSQ